MNEAHAAALGDVRSGSVTFDRARVYDHPDGFNVSVPAGTYPVYRTRDGQGYWVMVGQPSVRVPNTTKRIGDGMFELRYGGDVINDRVPPVEVRSGMQRWAAIVDDVTNPPRRPDGSAIYTITLDVPS